METLESCKIRTNYPNFLSSLAVEATTACKERRWNLWREKSTRNLSFFFCQPSRSPFQTVMDWWCWAETRKNRANSALNWPLWTKEEDSASFFPQSIKPFRMEPLKKVLPFSRREEGKKERRKQGKKFLVSLHLHSSINFWHGNFSCFDPGFFLFYWLCFPAWVILQICGSVVYESLPYCLSVYHRDVSRKDSRI